MSEQRHHASMPAQNAPLENQIPWDDLQNVTADIVDELRPNLRRPKVIDWCIERGWRCFQAKSDNTYAFFNYENFAYSRGFTAWLQGAGCAVAIFPPGEIRSIVAAHELGHAFDSTLGRHEYLANADYCEVEPLWIRALNCAINSRDDASRNPAAAKAYCESFAEWFFISQYAEHKWTMFHETIHTLPGRIVTDAIKAYVEGSAG